MIISSNLCRLSLISLFFLMILPGCWPLNVLKQEESKPEFIIINVLEPSEYDDCHIQGSINVPFDAFESEMKTLSKSNHYVIYCSDYMCMSSGYCAQLLQKNKFNHVWAYEGGMAEWYQKGYPYQGPAHMEYLKNVTEYNPDESEENNGVKSITAEDLLKKMKEYQQK